MKDGAVADLVFVVDAMVGVNVDPVCVDVDVVRTAIPAVGGLAGLSTTNARGGTVGKESSFSSLKTPRQIYPDRTSRRQNVRGMRWLLCHVCMLCLW